MAWDDNDRGGPGDQNPWSRGFDSGWDEAQGSPSMDSRATESDKAKKSILWIVIGLALVVVLAAAVAIVGWYLGWFDDRQDSGTSVGPVTSTLYVTEESVADEDDSSELSSDPSSQESPSGSPGAEGSNSASRDSGESRTFNDISTGNSVTSEPFAQNVGRAFLQEYEFSGDTSPNLSVWSPVTEKTYSMSCTDNGSYVVCRGGNNAVVFIE